jgi:hypothetical protein
MLVKQQKDGLYLKVVKMRMVYYLFPKIIVDI